MMTSKAQLKANKKWKDNNKEKQRKYNAKSQTKKFINEYATDDELVELKQLIENRLEK